MWHAFNGMQIQYLIPMEQEHQTVAKKGEIETVDAGRHRAALYDAAEPPDPCVAGAELVRSYIWTVSGKGVSV